MKEKEHSMTTMALAEWLEMVPDGTTAYYKDCKILDWAVIGERWCLLTVLIPLPVGGTYKEIVSIETQLELKEKENHMKIYLCNVFTTAMLPNRQARRFDFTPLTLSEAKMRLEYGFEQAVGHPATCEVLSARLGLDVQPVRANVRLEHGDLLIVAQVVTPRLPEGQVLSREQVESCAIEFWQVKDVESRL